MPNLIMKNFMNNIKIVTKEMTLLFLIIGCNFSLIVSFKFKIKYPIIETNIQKEKCGIAFLSIYA